LAPPCYNYLFRDSSLAGHIKLETDRNGCQWVSDIPKNLLEGLRDIKPNPLEYLRICFVPKSVKNAVTYKMTHKPETSLTFDTKVDT